MAQWRIFFDIGGKWNETESCWVWHTDCNLIGIYMDEKDTLETFVDKICRKCRIDGQKHSLQLSWVPNLKQKSLPVVIKDNDDLLFFRDIAHEVPLHVIVDEKFINPEEHIDGVKIKRNPLHDDFFDRDFMGNVATDEFSTRNDIPPQSQPQPESQPQLEPQPLAILNEVEVAGPLVCMDKTEFGSSHGSTFSDGSSLEVGQYFTSKNDLKEKLHLIALKGKFEFRTTKSNKDVLVVECVDPKCVWRIRACKLRLSNMFVIRKYNGVHSCSLEKRSAKHRQATYSVIGSCMKNQFVGVKQGPVPKSIQKYARDEFGTAFSYYKGWKAREHALQLVRGTAEESFTQLPSYFHMVSLTNHGSITNIHFDEQNRFMYLFLAYGPCIRGFGCMRKVISVDGTWLKGKFRGTLLVATAQDSERHCYPIAWAIVDSENDASWTWFFSNLKVIVTDSEELVFISDRNQSISNALSTVYSLAHHGCCTWHVSQNIKSNFSCSGVLPLFFRTSEAYRIDEFSVLFDELSARYPSIARYLQEQVRFEMWSRAHFKGNRYNIMTTNMSESMNAMLKDVRDYPVIALFNFIQAKMSEWFNNRRVEASKIKTLLTPSVEKTLRERHNKAGFLTATRLNTVEFQVTGGEATVIVNIGARSCTCRVFDLEQIPCEHAISCCREAGMSLYDLCSKYYRTEVWALAYAETIYPVPDTSQWDIPNHVKEILLLPPRVQPKRGRPKQKRIPSIGEFTRRKNRCARCGQYGHYQKKCKNAPM